jgi:hypothetical protein
LRRNYFLLKVSRKAGFSKKFPRFSIARKKSVALKQHYLKKSLLQATESLNPRKCDFSPVITAENVRIFGKRMK